MIGDGGKNKIDSVFVYVLILNDFVIGWIDRRRDMYYIDLEWGNIFVVMEDFFLLCFSLERE